MAEAMTGSDSSIQKNINTIQSIFGENVRSSQKTHVQAEVSKGNPGRQLVSTKSSNKEMVFCIREIQYSKTDSSTQVKQYSITTETIIKAVEDQSEEDVCTADKYLNIVVRNLFGQFRTIKPSYYDEQVNRVMRIWKHWYELGRSTRSTPLLYKCYICNKGWWRLHPFKEHLSEHGIVKLKTEQYEDEFCIYACTRNEPGRKSIEVDTPCWRCGENVTKHKIINKSVNYTCIYCDGVMTTCSKYKEHESKCFTYNNMIYNRDLLKEKIECIVCGILYFGREVLSEHLVDYHLVRSDEPIAIDASVCRLCDGRYVMWKYHDCPSKNTIVKCHYCSRKFSSVVLKNVHNQFLRDKVKCKVCGKCMVGCMAPEHYLKHSKNYALARICWKCDNRVLYTKLRYFNAHMKHHVSSKWRKKWSELLLLPKMCLNGEMVESEKVLSIPNEKLDEFMYGLENTNQENIKNQPSKALVNGVVMDQDPDILAMQEQLDAEIMRDMEMEAAISEVFKTSNSYRKLIEKEKMERRIKKKGPMKKNLEDENSSDDDLVIVEENDENVINDSESFKDDSPDDIIIIEENDEIGLDDSECEDNIQSTLEGEDIEEDSISEKETQKSDKTNDDGSDIEDDLEWIVSSVAQEKDLNIDLVKRKSETQREVESNKATEQEIVASPKKEIQSTESQIVASFGKEMQSNQSVIIASVEKEVQLEDNKDSTEETKALQLYKCKECHLTGDWNQYIVHVITECITTGFKCIDCHKFFSKLCDFLCHLVEHGHTKELCPICRQHLPTVTFNEHVTRHIKDTFPDSYIEKFSHSSGNYIFGCSICSDNLPLDGLLEHWQMHFVNELFDDENMEIDISKDEIEKQIKEDVKTIEKNYSEIAKTISDVEEVEYVTEYSTNTETSESGIQKCEACRINMDSNQYIVHCIAWCYYSDFTCNKCDRKFENLKHYLKHLVVHGYSESSCPMCGQEFRHAGIMCRHVSLHIKNTFVRNNTKPKENGENCEFICLKCNSKVKSKHLLQHWITHIDKVHNADIQMEMDENNTEVDKKSGIEEVSEANAIPNPKHQMPMKPMQMTDLKTCKNCNFNFRGDWKQYILHISRCLTTELKCNICEGAFGGMRNFVDHLKKHGYRNLTCPICDKPFEYGPGGRLALLTTHVIYHIMDNFSINKESGPKPCLLLTCLQCKGYVKLEDFFIHWQKHLGVDREKNRYQKLGFYEKKKIMRPEVIEKVLVELESCSRKRYELQCDVCREIFKLKNNYKIHMINHLCEQAMSSEEYLMRKHLECYYCDKIYLNTMDWKTHMIAHSSLPVFECSKCSKVFHNPWNRVRHTKRHCNTFICDVCGTKFPTRRSIIKHFKEDRCNNTSSDPTSNVSSTHT